MTEYSHWTAAILATLDARRSVAAEHSLRPMCRIWRGPVENVSAELEKEHGPGETARAS